jgi:hypothetical protein
LIKLPHKTVDKWLFWCYNKHIDGKEHSMMVQDKKTGQWYDPEQKMKELLGQQWFLNVMKRMAAK